MNAISSSQFTCIVVGGGLQSALIVQAVRHHQPLATVLVIEKSERLCGNHTWSFHAGDVPDSAQRWLSRMPIRSWSGYSVQFPNWRRRVSLKYCSLGSQDVRREICRLAEQSSSDVTADRGSSLQLLTGVTATHVTPTRVDTSDGRMYRADLVVDCRGRVGGDEASQVKCGFQKFHGFEVELDSEGPIDEPILMDARIKQLDGFRFLYLLPSGTRRVLIEETRFSDSPQLRRTECLRSMQTYLRQRGITRFEIIREESGCLPMPYSEHLRPSLTVPVRGGYAGGWFHAATGYSFPLAVRFADAVASGPLQEADQRISLLAEQQRFQARFSRFLNRLLFRGVQPNRRWQIFRRFYSTLSDAAIRRFYAHRFSRLDAARIIIGKPPRGLTPVRFFNSFEAFRCPLTQS